MNKNNHYTRVSFDRKYLICISFDFFFSLLLKNSLNVFLNFFFFLSFLHLFIRILEGSENLFILKKTSVLDRGLLCRPRSAWTLLGCGGNKIFPLLETPQPTPENISMKSNSMQGCHEDKFSQSDMISLNSEKCWWENKKQFLKSLCKCKVPTWVKNWRSQLRLSMYKTVIITNTAN